MSEEKPIRTLCPSIALDTQLLEILALDYVKKLPGFRGRDLVVERVLNRQYETFEGIRVTVEEEEEEQ